MKSVHSARRRIIFDLLRSFYEIRETDRVEAGLIAATLVRRVIDGFFAINRIWTSSTGQAMSALSAANRAGAAATRRVLESPLEYLCKEPELLDKMVRLTIGT